MKKGRKVSRRTFLKTGSSATAVMALSAKKAFSNSNPSPLNKWPGRVVINYNNQHNATITGGTAGDKTILKKMADDAIKLLTGQPTVGEAWRAIFPDTIDADSKIAIKINLLSTGVVPGHPFIVMGIVDGLMQMNVGTSQTPATLQESNITIYDANNSSSSMNALGYTSTNFPNVTRVPRDTLSSHGDGVRGYSYANSLANADFLINIPGMRGHGSSWGSATLGFKSHLGTYPTGPAHGDPPNMLRDYNCLGPVYDKTVLTVCNAIYATNYNNGPSTNGSPDSYNTYAKTKDPSVSTSRRNADTIIFSTDPVSAEFQIHKVMRINRNQSYTTASMPNYLRASGGVTGALNPTYNIGVIEEADQVVGNIINEENIGWTGPDPSINTAKGVKCRLAVHPNPAHTYAYFEFRTQEALIDKKAQVEVYNLKGRLVFKADKSVLGIVNHVVWNGRTNSGRAVASGKYIVYVKIGKEVLRSTFTLLR
jgi:hypothetical protein